MILTALGLTNVSAICNACNDNGVACISQNEFQVCIDGVADTSKSFTCTGANELCTTFGRACMDPTATQGVTITPACGDTSKCGVCTDALPGGFTCTSRTSYTMCSGGSLTDVRGYCPDKYICNVNEASSGTPCVLEGCNLDLDQLCDLSDPIDGPIDDPDATTTVLPVTTTAPPVTTTAPPVTTTAPPVTTTAPPVTTTVPPVTTTAPPVTTTARPVTTTARPVTTTAQPVTTTVPPVTTTAPPVTTTVPPVTTTAPPETTTAPPETTTALPETTTASPETTTAPPETTTAPPETTTAPPETTTAPPETTTAPPETTTAPPVTTTAPPETTTVPPETTTVPPATTTTVPPVTLPTPNEVCFGYTAAGRYPYPGDTGCTNYVYCFWKGGYLQGTAMTCPAGLYFSAEANNCINVKPATCV
ncbi:hepatitis A virus cellular receptor 1-like isoform X2 [Teleopsis dalmanni]|nr:hepatitis A virus cellular receptor 1-like isoform X2 [Teleopsis dalmanni]